MLSSRRPTKGLGHIPAADSCAAAIVHRQARPAQHVGNSSSQHYSHVMCRASFQQTPQGPPRPSPFASHSRPNMSDGSLAVSTGPPSPNLPLLNTQSSTNTKPDSTPSPHLQDVVLRHGGHHPVVVGVPRQVADLGGVPAVNEQQLGGPVLSVLRRLRESRHEVVRCASVQRPAQERAASPPGRRRCHHNIWRRSLRALL